MKKCLLLIATLLIALSLTGCSGDSQKDKSDRRESRKEKEDKEDKEDKKDKKEDVMSDIFEDEEDKINDDINAYEQVYTLAQCALANESVWNKVKESTLIIEVGRNGMTIEGEGKEEFQEGFEQISGDTSEFKTKTEAPTDNGNYRIVVEKGIVKKEVYPKIVKDEDSADESEDYSDD